MTVRWEWTGDGTHDAVERDDAFNSGTPTGESDEVYEFDDEDPGTYLYYCERHEGRGMKGAVVGGEGDDGGGGNESDGQSESGGTGYDDGNQSDETGSYTAVTEARSFDDRRFLTFEHQQYTMGNNPLDRRRFLQATSAAVTTTLLAGCGGSGNEGGDSDSDGDGGMDDTETEEDGAGDTETEDGGGGGDGNGEVDEFLSDTSNYDGVQDETGNDEVTVTVGAEGNDGNFAFEPAAVEVDAGTDVVWEWSGQGGQHNVAHEGDEFESETTDEEGFTFTHTFEEAGTHLYVCTPHESLGMKGAVVVSE